MKILFLIPFVMVLLTPAYGQLLSDTTGLVNRLDIQTGGETFEVETVSNFDVIDFEFDKNEKRLTLYIDSGLEKNLGEIIIPNDLLRGTFTFYLNDQEFFPKVNSNEKISFISLNFTGSGNNKLDVIGTIYLNGLIEKDEISISEPNLEPSIDYDYELIYGVVIIIILVVGGIIAAIIFVIKRKNS